MRLRDLLIAAPLAWATLVLCGCVIAGILPGCTSGPRCVETCATVAPEPVATVERSVQDAKGHTVASTPTLAPGFDLAGCVAACSLANCLAGCGR